MALLLAAVLFGAGSRTGAALGMPDRALGGALFLALWVLAETIAAASWRFSPPLAAAVSLAAVIAPFLRRGSSASRRADDRPADAAECRLLVVVALALAVPLLRLPVPLDTDAQGFGQLALSLREGGNLASLAPFRPGISYLYAPGGLALFASLSTLLPRIPISDVMMGASHAVALLFVALAGSFGEELARGSGLPASGTGDPPGLGAWRRAAQVGAILGLGLWTALLDAHFTAVLGLTFGLASVIAWQRAWRTAARLDFGIAAGTLAALAVTHQDSALAVAFGLVPLSVAALASAPRALRPRMAGRTAIALGLATLSLTPWLLRIAPLVGTGVASPFTRSPSHWRQMVLYQGVALPALALAGAALGARRRIPWSLGMLGWLALVTDFSIGGILERTFPKLAAPVTRFAFPFSLAWHGPILPYLALGTLAVAAWAARRRVALELFPGRRTAIAAVLAVAACGVFARPLLALVFRRIPVYGALSSDDDVRAMRWIRREAPLGARVLNYPGDHERMRDWEGHWAPALTERDCVYFRMQPFFLGKGAEEAPGGLEQARREQREMLSFWRDPSDPSNEARLRAAGVRYVLVPESVGDPDSLSRAWRGRPPALLAGVRSAASRAAYLRPVFRSGGAEVYALR